MKTSIVRILLFAILLGGGVAVPGVADAERTTVQQSRPTLRREARGDAVRELQRLLNTWIAREQPVSLQPLPVTGYFGALTDRIVRTFQRAKNLVVDGIVGPRTWAALQAALPDALVPIIDRDSGFLLGAARGGTWLTAQAAAPLLTGTTTYRLFGNTGAKGTITGSAPRKADVPCEQSFQVTGPSTASQTNTIGMAGSWNPLPRVPQTIPLNSSVYRDAVATVLRERGIASPDVRLTAAWRVDMDGDGTSEVVLTATRRAEGYLGPSAAAGDYSVVVIRKVVNGAVQTIVPSADVYPQAKDFNAPSDFKLIAALDLNGDGRLELVYETNYYEGSSTGVYTLVGTKVTEVLIAGCGV